MKITLASHVITFEPPQRLLMFEATRERGGENVRILHASGHEEEEGAVEIIAWAPLPGLSDEAAAIALPEELLAALPLLAELDVWDPPAQYRTLPEAAKGSFEFQRGEQYAVAVLAGGTFADVKVIAE